MNSRRRIPAALTLAALAALCAAPGAAAAGDLRFVPYIWIPGVDCTTAFPDSGTGGELSLDFTQGLKIGGAMVNLAWREGRVVLLGDWTYANVSSTAPSPYGTLYSGVSAQVIGNVGQFFNGYAVLDRPEITVDLLTGARLYDLRLKAGLEAGAAEARSVEAHGTWLDAVAAAQADWRPADKWHVYVRADVGTGGSNLTWQGYLVGAYDFSWGSIVAGWRHLYVDHGSDALRLKLTLAGPLVGAGFSF